MFAKLMSIDLSANLWIAGVFTVVLITLIFDYIVQRSFRRLLPVFEKTHNVWDDAIIKAMQRPSTYLIWMLGFSFAFQIVADKIKIDDSLITLVFNQGRQISIIAVLVWFVIRFVSEIEIKLIDPKRRRIKGLDAATVNAFCQFIRLAVIITAVLIALQTFNIKISGILAVGGVGTIAIGFAAKEWLSNFFGGLMIYLDRPFSVGDWVRSPDKSIEGTVENIGWRLTTIRTFDKRPLYVPNGVFSTIAIENPSRMSNRRIYAKIGLRYQDSMKIKKVLSDVKSMLQQHDEIDQHQTMLVNLIEFGDSALVFMVYTFTKTTNWAKFQDVQQDVFLKIIEIIHQNNAQCAFPTTTIHVPDVVSLQQSNSFKEELV